MRSNLRNEVGNFGSNATKLVLVLPALGLTVTSVVVVVGLSPTVVSYAELHGGPAEGSEGFYGRALAFEEEAEIARPLAGEELRVGVRSGERVREVVVTTGEDGSADFAIERELPSETRDIWIHDARGGVLVEGRLDAKKLARLVPAARRGGRVALDERGTVPFDVFVERGVLAAPFRGKLLVRPRPNSGSAERLEVSSRGARLDGPRDFRFDGRAEIAFELTPLGHDIELELRIFEGAEEIGKAVGRVPVVPGAFFPEFSEKDVKIRSPIARDFVYFAWHTQRARLASGRAALSNDADGTPSATIPRLRNREPLYLVLASDPDGDGAGTVGFPVEPGSSTLDRKDALLLDGRGVRIAIEKTRTTRLRRALVLYVGLLFSLTLALFVTILRRSARKLETSLAPELESAVVSPKRDVLVPALVIAFGMSGALLWFAFLAR